MLLRRASDERLGALAGTGDERAFEVIIERHGPPLLGHCRSVAGDGGHDALQQAFISAWGALRRGEQVRDLRAWLYTIAHRAALQVWREQRRGAAELTDEASACAPHEQSEQLAHVRAVLAAVAELPEHERDALVWTSIHGRSGREVARALGVSEDALRQLVMRARTRTRAAVAVLGSLPPLTRLPRLALHAARRLAGVGSLTSGGTLAGVAPVLATAVLVSAPVAALELGHSAQSHTENGRSAAIPSARAGARTHAPAHRLAPRRTRHARAAASRGTATAGARTVAPRQTGAASAAPLSPSAGAAAEARPLKPGGLNAVGSLPAVVPPPVHAPAPPSGGAGEALAPVTGFVHSSGAVAGSAVTGVANQALEHVESARGTGDGLLPSSGQSAGAPTLPVKLPLPRVQVSLP
ncbi:MAG TPA: sigma-70 family RNA polymerase sigma factor [Solirubrobacteraceae bacterium]|nr:sigma-70 family RNA polymerase sigma factor [Solirubrobacteraceae bacterium]